MDKDKDQTEVVISPWSVVTTVLILAVFYFIYYLRDIILLFFVVIILAVAFRPIANRWSRKIGRVTAVFLLLLIFIALLALLIYVIVPPLITEFTALIKALPDLIASMNKVPIINTYLPSLQENLKQISFNPSRISQNFLSLTVNVFGALFAIVTILVLTVYMLLEKNGLSYIVMSLFPPDKYEAIISVTKKITDKVGNWFRGQLLLCLTIGVLDFIILIILGVPYALPLALIAGVLEIVPTIGPIISGIIAVLVALTVSPLVAIIAIILFILIQQLENSYLVPKIMQKAVGLSPVIIILAILIGAKIFGVIGALLAVPIAASFSVIIQEWPIIKQTFQKNGRPTATD